MQKSIRRIELSDARAISEMYAPFVLNTAVSFEAVPPDEKEIQQRIGEITPKHPWLVLDVDHAILGFAYASTHRTRHAYQWSTDVSVYVDERVRNRRVGRTLYTALFHLLRQQGFFSAYAGITLPNPASVRLHESMGFSPVGVYSRVGFKLGNWHDVTWLQLRLAEGLPSGPPESVDGLLEDKAVLAFLAECALSVKLD